MRRHHHQTGYDVYDDTGGRRHDRRERPSFRRQERVRRDPMVGMIERLEQDMFGLHNSLFSPMRGGLMQDFFGCPPPHPGEGGSSYVYESHSRRVDSGGRVYEERVRSQPGSDGRPRTVRTVRNPDGSRQESTSNELPAREPLMGIFGDMDFGWPFGGLGRSENVQRLPPTRVEEVPDEEEEIRRRQRRHGRSSSRRHGRRDEPIVEEPDD